MNTNSEWEVCYQAAVFELDDANLRVKIDETRRAIDQRLLQACYELGMKERRDMSNALEVLLVLERFLDRHTKVGRPAASLAEFHGVANQAGHLGAWLLNVKRAPTFPQMLGFTR
jgi:hypothetical protein